LAAAPVHVHKKPGDGTAEAHHLHISFTRTNTKIATRDLTLFFESIWLDKWSVFCTPCCGVFVYETFIWMLNKHCPSGPSIL
jgi:hypothetical protein